MVDLQNILLYVSLAIAVGYVIRKYLVPKKLFTSKTKKQKGCGSSDCGCH